jgi:hypothetical protein
MLMNGHCDESLVGCQMARYWRNMEGRPSSPRDAQSATRNVLFNSLNETSLPADEPASKHGELTMSMTSDKFRDVTDAVLNFLSTASKERCYVVQNSYAVDRSVTSKFRY